MINNKVIQQLPAHLKAFVIDQHYERYSPQDQAVWRFVMRQNIKYLRLTAHSSYLKGLKKTGISTGHIPTIAEMNKALRKLGWAAATVDGFIPPSVFMEFQAHKVLAIAADIRTINQIGYTPAPDIIHEAAGHAPIIADSKYAEYLRYFGEIGSKAFSSSQDYKMYEAIRHLSILKADPNSIAVDIAKAEEALAETGKNMGMPSEMALIRNLHWWTVEYGLIGSLKKPKIYGAGLLSSITESKSALSNAVHKIPYSLEAMHYGFDITKPQPQLFVTPDFESLIRVLNEFAQQMALKTGGLEAIMKVVHSGSTGTLVYSSGLQVSGTFADVRIHKGQAVYINTTGPTTLNYNNKMLTGHTKQVHKEGFGSPIGKLKSCLKPVSLLDDVDLDRLSIQKGRHSVLEFESDLMVEGTLMQVVRKEGKIVLMRFTDCKVTHGGRTLFEPSLGMYDMAVGEKITAAFNGPADAEGFELQYDAPTEKTHKISYDKKTLQLHNLYRQVDEINGKLNSTEKLSDVWRRFLQEEHDDWLLPLELFLKIKGKDKKLSGEILSHLNKIKQDNYRKPMIESGLETAM